MQPPMDQHPTIFGYHPNSLAGLLPDPPSQPPPDSHGPPILSNNEVSQFNSRVEALTSTYTHTPNWKDPPSNSTRTRGNAPLNTSTNMEMFEEYWPQYHGMFDTVQPLLSQQNSNLNQQFGSAATATIAPQLIQSVSEPNMHMTANMDQANPTIQSMDSRNLNLSDTKSFYHSILTASHPAYSAPFSNESMAQQDQENILLAATPSMNGLPPHNEVVSSSSPPRKTDQGSPQIPFGTDPGWTSQNLFTDADRSTTGRSLAYYGLEAVPSNVNTRRNSPERDFDGQQLRSPHKKHKTKALKSEAPLDGQAVETSRKRKRPSLKGDSKDSESRETTHDVSLNGPSAGQRKGRGKIASNDKKRRKKNSPRPRLSESQKKENHKASEAKRRARIEKAQLRLFTLVPGMKLSQAFKKKLDETMRYMRSVKENNSALTKELQKIERLRST